MRRRYGALGLLIAGVAAAAVLFVISRPPARRVLPGSDVRDPAAAAPVVADAGATRFRDFIGDDACAACHAELAESYRRTGMARSWGRPAGTVAASSAPVRDETRGFAYRALRDEGRLLQEETLLEELDERPHRLVRAAEYAVGSGDHAQTFLWEDHGYLYQLPLAWYASRGDWGLNPGYELLNHRFDRVIPPGCIACHGTYAVHRPFTRNRYERSIPDGIGCERCHGPGRAHVEFQNAPARGPGGTDPIVNPAALAGAAGNDVCLQCHLQGDVTLYPPGRDAFSFRPGERLSEHRLDFLLETGDAETLGVASHGARMMRSACRTERGEPLTCFACHDPHVPVRETPRAAFDAKCAACHAPQSCGRSAPEAEQDRAEGCAGCHMPQRPTREGQHLVFTDHWIRRSAAPVPPAPLLPPNSRVELAACWPEADPHGDRRAAALILLHESMGPQEPSLSRGVEHLRVRRRQGALDADGLYALGSGLVSQRRGSEAAEVFRELLARDPSRLDARFRLAVAYDQAQDRGAAVAEYRRVVEAAPDWLEPYPLLSRLLLARGETSEARVLMQRHLSLRRDVAGLTGMAAVELTAPFAQDRPQTLLEEILALDPLNTTVRLQRAYLHQHLGELEAAAAGFRDVLKLDPNNDAARSALQVLRGPQAVPPDRRVSP